VLSRVPKNEELALIPSTRFFEEQISENRDPKLAPLSRSMFDSMYAILKERANHNLIVTRLASMLLEKHVDEFQSGHLT
jgi:hypothetical protein